MVVALEPCMFWHPRGEYESTNKAQLKKDEAEWNMPGGWIARGASSDEEDEKLGFVLLENSAKGFKATRLGDGQASEEDQVLRRVLEDEFETFYNASLSLRDGKFHSESPEDENTKATKFAKDCAEEPKAILDADINCTLTPEEEYMKELKTTSVDSHCPQVSDNARRQQPRHRRKLLQQRPLGMVLRQICF